MQTAKGMPFAVSSTGERVLVPLGVQPRVFLDNFIVILVPRDRAVFIPVPARERASLAVRRGQIMQIRILLYLQRRDEI